MKRVLEKTALWIVSITLLMACNPDFEDKSDKVFTSLQVILSGFEGNTDTRTQENGYQTSFTGNEQIGIFSLKTSNNTILENNVPYKYNASTTSWQPVNAGNQIYMYDSGVTYYAYYPYNSNMDDKKSIAEITTAFTLPEDQSTYDNYSSADLMTATGTLNSSTLSLTFTHAMSLIEIAIDETSNSSASYNPAPMFYGITPWKMSDGLYRYLVKPGTDVEIGFDYGPADNRYAFQKSLAAADITAGKYTRIKAPFDNRCFELNTGNYVGVLGSVSKVVINGTEYSASLISESNNRYLLDDLRKSPETFTSFSIYITDNLAKADSKEQLLLTVTTSNITIDATNKSLTVSLSAGGMEGAGTSATDPYLVTTPPQLRGVDAEGTNNNSLETEYYEQKADLDLSAYDNWKPVKSGALYDGKGYKVNNLVSTQGGIFSSNGGTIQNVHLTSGTINVNNKTAGGIVNESTLSGHKILNCSNAATITAINNGDIGGVVGNGSHSIIEYCKNSGNITMDACGGGIVGLTWGNQVSTSEIDKMDTEIRYCYNTGTITKSSANRNSGDIGGIIGRLVRTKVLEYCYNAGQLIDNGGNNRIGSIMGELDNSHSKNNYGVSVTSNKLHYSNNAGTTTNDNFFNNPNSWPAYSTDTSNGWGSTHWQSYNLGEYPKLLWEP
ncbi:fimbrillin family protein [uncultured Bacteroides sp.]|uniref:fimbrillin family protein n=1 Tax=uncultured Bacteroides sp. TaxID=162156 RepID=UPI0025EB8688|nr:fimbrillin family protein [uncultured Bacteroides sp.]